MKDMKLIHKFNPITMGLIGFLSWLLVPIFSSVYCGSKDRRNFWNDNNVFDSNGYDNYIDSLSGYCEFYQPINSMFGYPNFYYWYEALLSKELIYISLLSAFIAMVIQFIVFYFFKVREEDFNKNNTIRTIINYQLLLILTMYIWYFILVGDANFW